MVIGVTFLFTAIAIPPASAVSWGNISAESSYGTYWLGRYETGEISLSVSYTPYFVAYFPLWVEIQITQSPSWLTVTPSQSTFALQARANTNIQILLAVNTHDIKAGTTGNVELYLTGKIILGGQLRTIDPARVNILVGYNPFTEISLTLANPIARTAPDRELAFPIKVVNWGNAPTTVTLGITNDENGWEYIVSPQQIKVEAKKSGDASYPEQTVMFTVTSPHGTGVSYHNNWQGFTVEGSARTDAQYYTLQGGQWAPSQQDKEKITIFTTYATVLAKNKGFYVPGFDVILLVGVLGALALFMAKKKKTLN